MSYQLSMRFMNGIHHSALLLGVLFLFSCGPGVEEKARQASIQKAREDSIRMAAEVETKLKMERKLMLSDSLQQERTMVEGINNRLTYFEADLAAAKDKLEVIKQPQFLRTPTEREQQVRMQIVRISEVEEEITQLRKRLNDKHSMVRKWEAELLVIMN